MSKDDDKINELIKLYGENWEKIKEHFPKKTAKQLKDHYDTHLKPGLDTSKWDLAADLELLRLLAMYGCDWTTLAKNMPDRAYAQIKNRYYGRIAKIIQKKLQVLVKEEAD